MVRAYFQPTTRLPYLLTLSTYKTIEADEQISLFLFWLALAQK